MADSCPIIVGDGIASFVYTGYSSLMGYAGAAYQLATQTFNQLINYDPGQVTVDVQYQFDDSLFGVIRPLKPDAFTDTVDTSNITLADPPPSNAQRPAFDFSPPPLTATPPDIEFPNQPGNFNVPDPGAPPILADVVVPATPVIVLPTEPALINVLPLPDPPSISLPTFQGIRPAFNIPDPDPNVQFTPTLYTSDLLDQVKAKLSSMLQGGTGLPEAVETALINRAVEREDISVDRALQETVDSFGTMGYTEPSGVLAGRLRRVRQDAFAKRASLSRDIYVKSVDIEIENLRFSVTQGVAIESALLSNWIQYQQLILESQKLVLQVAVELTNVRVQIFNAQLRQFEVDATVYKTLIEGELAKLEIYRTELEAKKILLQLNQQQIEIYEARLKAVMTAIDIYRAQIEGVKALVETNNQRLEGFRTLVQVFAERVRAYQAQWEGYKAAADAQGIKAQIFDTSVKAYLGEVQAWSTKNSNYAEVGKFDIALDESRLDRWKGLLEKYVNDLKTKIAVFDADVQAYDSTVKAYSAEATVEMAASEANSRIFELGMRREQARKEIAIENVKLEVQELVELSAQLLEAKKAVAAGAGQLSAAAMSSVHFGATASSSLAQGQSCNTNYSFNTELLPDN